MQAFDYQAANSIEEVLALLSYDDRRAKILSGGTDLLAQLREGRLPRRAVAITFDDGYADSLYAVSPLCERFDLPATVFVTAGYLDGRREFWWDDLEAQTLGRGVTATQDLELEVNGERLTWPTGTPLRAVYDALHVRLRPATAPA